MSISGAKLDTSAAQAYEDHLVTHLFGPWAQRVIEYAMPITGREILDVACGTGIGARLIAPFVAPGGSIVSSDIDPAMIEVAKSTCSDLELSSDIATLWHASSAELPVVEAGSMDFCLCLQGPQFLDNPAEGIAQLYRSLKNGGQLAASVWNEYSTNKGHYAIGQALLKRKLKPALKPFSLGNPEQLKTLLTTAGFAIERFTTDELIVSFQTTKGFIDAIAAGAPATRHALAQLQPTDYEAFIADVDKQLSVYKTSEGLKLPTSAHVVLAIKPR